MECPTRANVGSGGNGGHAVTEAAGAGFVLGMDTAEAFSNQVYLVAEDLFGYPIVDTGATRSMTSIKQMQWL